MEINRDNMYESLFLLNKKDGIKLTLHLVKLIDQLNFNSKVKATIQAVEAWIEDSSEKNAEIAEKANDAIFDIFDDDEDYIFNYAVYAISTAAWLINIDSYECNTGCNIKAITCTAIFAAINNIKLGSNNPEKIEQQIIFYIKELCSTQASNKAKEYNFYYSHSFQHLDYIPKYAP
jgi:hypothetical protein